MVKIRGECTVPDALVSGEVPDAHGVSGDGEGFPGLKTKTLFMGVPLRTKTGKEVLLQVQGVINKLEAYGYPVQRFHADRAKELRSAALISWLKDKGVHPTWTPGDSPAGNRAELAVQNLKGVTRKLLFITKLAPMYWPLALCHASERNWVQFGESLGQPRPLLLPFGSEVQARKRFKTGFDAQWQSRFDFGNVFGAGSEYSRRALSTSRG